MYVFLPFAESKLLRAGLVGTELAKLNEMIERPLTD
jgi:hypothetical protein